MTYNWNTMVEITVPTGTNGWLYSGEVIINGVKVRFPVGVPTSVPEPAAVLLKKMIELEQEEDANTAKPQNHYVGDVTIPAGKTLTLEKGSKLVDNSGGGEVVILPETVLTGEGPQYALPAQPENTPTAGGTYKIVWDGVEYVSPALDVTETMGEGMPAFTFGDTSIMLGEEGAAAMGNPLPGAPFVLMLAPNGVVIEEGEPTIYGIFMATTEPTNPTLSIVQTEGAASGGESAGGGVVVATAIIADDETVTSIDKPYAELLAAFDAGKPVQMIVKSSMADFMMPLIVHLKLGGDYLLFSAYTDTKNLTLKASLRYNADGTSVYASA